MKATGIVRWIDECGIRTPGIYIARSEVNFTSLYIFCEIRWGTFRLSV